MNAKKNCNKTGRVYVLASRPYIDKTAYTIERLRDWGKKTAYFYLLYDMRYPCLTIPECSHENIDFTICETLTFSMVKDTIESKTYEVIVIDFIQAMCYTENQVRRLKILQVMQGLKKLAKRTGVDIVVLSSVKRKFNRNKHTHPRARDIKDSLAIVPFADTVVMMGLPDEGKNIYLKGNTKQ